MSLKIVTISDGYGSETAPSVIDVSSGRVKHITLTGSEVALGYVALDVIPSTPENSILSWLGVTQTYGVDYEISGINLVFLFGISSEVEEGDKLTLYYQ